MRSLLAVLAVLCLARAAWPPADATIMTFGGPARTAYSPIAVNLDQHPQFVYSAQLQMPPIGDNNTLYTTSQQNITTINPATGAAENLYTVPNNRYSVSYITMIPDGFAACISSVYLYINGSWNLINGSTCAYSPFSSYDGTRVYYADFVKDTLVALDSQTAEVIWTLDTQYLTQTNFVAQDAEGFLYFGPAILNGTNVYLKVNGTSGDIVLSSQLENDGASSYMRTMIDVDLEILYLTNFSSIFAYNLDYELLWVTSNDNYNFDEQPEGGMAPMALNAMSNASVIYWCSQTYLYALEPTTGKVLWWLVVYPAQANQLINMYVTGDGTVFTVDTGNFVHAVNATNQKVLWTLNINNNLNGLGSFVPLGETAVVQGGGAVAALGYASITGSSGAVLAVGAGDFSLSLSAYPMLNFVDDTTVTSATCQAVTTATGAVVMSYVGMLYFGSHYLCTPSGATATGRADGWTVAISYSDGSVYTTPVFPQKFVVVSSITTSGPNMGNNTIEITGAGFSNCNGTGVACQGTFLQIPNKLFALTVVSDTLMTFVAPPSWAGSSAAYSSFQVQVKSGGLTTQSFVFEYNWESKPWLTPTVLAIIIGFPTALLIAGGVWMFYRCRMRRRQEESEALLSNKGSVPLGKR